MTNSLDEFNARCKAEDELTRPPHWKPLVDTRIHVYTASKTFRYQQWLTLRSLWKEINFVARWPELEGKIPENKEFAKVFWQHDIEDVKKADLLLLLAMPDDKLSGTIIEAGAAIGLGKPVILVGENQLFSTWQWHPLVYRASSLEEVRLLIGLMKEDLLTKRSEV